MQLEVLVEEPSAEAALQNILPLLVPTPATWSIYVHQGKLDLLARLAERLRAYSTWLPSDYRVVVLIDRDADDCVALKGQLDATAQLAGLTTRASVAPGARCQVLNRLAIEELEAWFFGDVEALRTAYPRLPTHLHQRELYRNPDAIRGGTWEARQRVLQQSGYYRNLRRLPKIEVARTISAHMHPDRNRSHSFQAFRHGLRNLMQEP